MPKIFLQGKGTTGKKANGCASKARKGLAFTPK